MLQLNYRDPRPIYQQVKDGFRRMIYTGALHEGDQLPSVRELAAQLAINPNTIQRAYRELLAEGVVVTVQGKGNFVARQKAHPPDEPALIPLWGALEQAALALLTRGVCSERILQTLQSRLSAQEQAANHQEELP